MLLIGLTGSIGMGKSETAKMFARHGVPVCDSDAIVHGLYDEGGAAVQPVGEAFPQALVQGQIDRQGRIDREVLSRCVVGKPEAIARLEGIVHPLVAQAQRSVLQGFAASGTKMVVLDIPLLFETKGEKRVDVVIVVSAPSAVQRKRVLQRPGMSAGKFEVILNKQMPDADKRARADFVVDTSQGFAQAEAQVVAIIDALKDRVGHIWRPNHA